MSRDAGSGNWLADTRTSYDTVAASYADLLRGYPAEDAWDRALFALFAELAGGAGAPVLDLGCGPGQVTAHLRDLGLRPRGIDLSPGMVELARRDHPDLPFEVGSMTDLRVPDASLAGVLLWYSLIHVPDAEAPAALAHVARVLRPGGVVLAGLHVGDETRFKTEGYGGHPMRLHVHLRPVERVAGWLTAAGARGGGHPSARPRPVLDGAAGTGVRPASRLRRAPAGRSCRDARSRGSSATSACPSVATSMSGPEGYGRSCPSSSASARRA